ncbi:ABC-type lipoprotein release transporter, ATP-binding protein (ATPase) [Desulforapulum autotrophicum HRM2]|uniref:ABC-type lipoprotein release transporter, ATP-binding protein (ATPase) n=1 Tax=Desulforapulum autotrophicum (strain ATCC 43914 / DSM 3382 / VKM B-1955 / HRM2) TaxID=177437 RepID=C0QBH4_DESAH|nr:ABC transporter ATP-binding protein [Desulforapulum autotrophicum]ACN16976.1 ABC-type lipoprotein release transporter, ATP-binding protein (ATPase) [Desulforapulum autotrophicum HRM2]
MPLVEAQGLEKTYQAGEIEIKAIRGVDFSIEPASFVAFIGPSGSGKSTLLNMIGCLDPPTGGTLTVAGKDVTDLSRREAARFRGEHIGFIFQDFNLIPVLTVFENVEYPLVMVQDWPKRKRREKVQKLLQAVGVSDQSNKYPGQISGGQKQRVAIARALVTGAKLVLADEPTANLDRKTAKRIIELMQGMRTEFGTTFIFSTHDPRVVENVETVFTLEDGRLQEEENHG